jgi:hypothetical protein
MDNISLVTTALEYHDNNTELYGNLFKNVKYIKFVQAGNDMEHNVIMFYDNNKNEIFRSKYELIGLYNTNSNTWTWAWAIPTFKKNNTNIIRKIWNYGAVLDPGEKYLKTELITSRFRVADQIQLDIHVGIASYLSKNPLIYKHYIYMQQKTDPDGYIQTRPDTDRNNETIYYMFLLDHKNINNEKNNNGDVCTSSSDEEEHSIETNS